DAVVSGQTWHWVDPVAGAAQAARVLRPGGRLAVFWNVGRPPAELVEAFVDVYRRMLPEPLASRASSAYSQNGYGVFTTKAVDGIRRAGGFGEPEEWRFEWDRTYTRDEWLDALPTSGAVALLSGSALDEIMTGVGAAIDAVGGVFTLRYTAVVVTAVRTASD
ncbi:MAG: SAM-dependent methyltransferase, partial [Saccharothrix sp.]|nr:SAM-dependent methyltransferase [Saccharothrix sp.]